MDKSDKFAVETVVNILKVDKGVLQILLFQKCEEPYKGYWMLPSKVMTIEETLETCSKKVLENHIGYSDIFLKQLSVFSELSRVSDSTVVGVSYLCLADSVTEKLKFHIDESLEYKWFSIDNIPKMVYDHNRILLQSLESFKKEVEQIGVLSILYPSDFTLPEVQKMLENLLNITIDRRNFRKKLINKRWICETGNISEPGNGRPGKLYCFNKDIKDERFFKEGL